LEGLVREGKKRETGSIESGGGSQMDLGGLGPESVISENLRFSLKIHGSHFSLKCHLSV